MILLLVYSKYSYEKISIKIIKFILEQINYNDSDEIENIIVGKLNIDIDDWKKNTCYDGRFYDYIDTLFSIISNWSEEQRKKLLKFVTGLSVVPINGFSDLHFDIEISDIAFPIAATCSNTLFIPYLEEIKKLEDKLLFAIENEEFGFS